MSNVLSYYPIKQELVLALRKADVLTGEFLRQVSEDAMGELVGMGLVENHALTQLGVVVRSWLMSGADIAPAEVARLLPVMA